MLEGRHSGAGSASRRERVPPALLRLACAASASALGAVACAGGAGHAANAEQQSLAEFDLAREAFENKRLREALEHVEKARALDDSNADAAYLGAIVLLKFCAQDERSSDCRYVEAEKYARQALEAKADMREAKNTLGVILIHEKRYEDAIAILKPLATDILYAFPENSWGNLGWAYLEKGKYDEAIDALRRAVAAQPLFCVGNYNLGLAFEKKGDLAAAREALTKSIETQRPECQMLQDAVEARARVSCKMGQRDEAKVDLERCRDMAGWTLIGKRCAAKLADNAC